MTNSRKKEELKSHLEISVQKQEGAIESLLTTIKNSLTAPKYDRNQSLINVELLYNTCLRLAEDNSKITRKDVESLMLNHKIRGVEVGYAIVDFLMNMSNLNIPVNEFIQKSYQELHQELPSDIAEKLQRYLYNKQIKA